jgi:hypothetical protein
MWVHLRTELSTFTLYQEILEGARELECFAYGVSVTKKESGRAGTVFFSVAFAV